MDKDREPVPVYLVWRRKGNWKPLLAFVALCLLVGAMAPLVGAIGLFVALIWLVIMGLYFD